MPRYSIAAAVIAEVGIVLFLAGGAMAGVAQAGQTARLLEGLPEGTRVTRFTTSRDRAVIGTNGLGIWVLSRNSTTLEKVEGLPVAASVTALAAVPGRVMIGTWRTTSMNPYVSASEGVWALPDGKKILRRIGGLPQDTTAKCFAEIGNRTLIGTYGHGLWAVSDDSFTATRIPGPPDGDPIEHIAIQGARALITTYYHGWWTSGAHDAAATLLPGTLGDKGPYPATCIATEKGRILVGTSMSGLWSVSDGSKKAVRIGGIPADQIVRCMNVTADGTVIGCYSGLYVLKPGSATAASVTPAGPRLSVTSVAQVGSTVYVGAEGTGPWELRWGHPVAERSKGVLRDVVRIQAYGPNQAIFWGARIFLMDDRSSEPRPVTGLPTNMWLGDTALLGGRILVGTDRGLWAIDGP